MVFPFFPLELLGGSSLQEALWDYPMAIWPGSGFVQVILVALTLLTPGVIDKLQSTKSWVKKVLKDLQKTKCLKPCDWYLFILIINIENILTLSLFCILRQMEKLLHLQWIRYLWTTFNMYVKEASSTISFYSVQ